MKIGYRVLCRLYNSVEHRFYGEYFEATIFSIDKGQDKPFGVNRGYDGLPIRLHRKEIRRIISREPNLEYASK